jgi:HPt (histidine-containing phosphotransfer) domain-containing protein
MDANPSDPTPTSIGEEIAAPWDSPPPGDGEERLFDFATAVARLDHDLELFREMAGFFCSDSVDLLRQLRDALGRGHARDVQRAAHSLKGLAATFDANPAMEAARRIEAMGSSGHLEQVEPALPQLEFEVTRLCQALADFCPPASP